jgi:hypothetical protein
MVCGAPTPPLYKDASTAGSIRQLDLDTGSVTCVSMNAEQFDRFARHFRAVNVVFWHEFVPQRY